MRTLLRPALVMLLAFTVVTGVAYPLLVTGIAQLVFPSAANGSLVWQGEQVVGSALIGQRFASDRYFWGRPSAAGALGYDASASSGSNLAPSAAALRTRLAADLAKLGAVARPIPADAVTASGSGLDPDISPASARLQVPRVAAARALPEAALSALIERSIQPPFLGLIGEPRINVLALNLALDALPGR